MPLNNLSNSGRTNYASRRSLNKTNYKTMKREAIFPLIVGIIVGGLVMIFWQFNVRLNNVAVGVNQLNQATSQNSKTVGDIVNFLNGNNKKAGNPATPSKK